MKITWKVVNVVIMYLLIFYYHLYLVREKNKLHFRQTMHSIELYFMMQADTDKSIT